MLPTSLVINDITFAEGLMQKLEEKKKILTLRCWKVKTDCYYLPLFHKYARTNGAENVNEPCLLQQRKGSCLRLGTC